MAGSRWSELPGDLLKIIEGHLGLYDDKIRFRCVCTHFEQSVSHDLPDLRQPPQPPWLLLPYKTGSICGLYHPFEKRVLDIDLPEAGQKVFRGNNHGWVVTTQTNGSIDVLNPLTRVRVPLPPRYTFPDVVQYDPNNIENEYLIQRYPGVSMNPISLSSTEVRDCKMEKIVLSSSPLSNDFTAVARFGYVRLAYCRAGDDRWREFDGATSSCFTDIAFYKGKLYAVSNRGHLLICDDIVSCPVLSKCESTPPYRHIMEDDDHLTNSSEGIMIVQRQTKLRITKVCGDSKCKHWTVGFEIYKLDEDLDRGWVNMESLDYDEILFMGEGSQIMFSQEEFRGTNGNRIYFASDHLQFDCEDVEDIFDNGMFDFEDGSFKPLGYECSPRVVWPSPIWFTPNPY